MQLNAHAAQGVGQPRLILPGAVILRQHHRRKLSLPPVRDAEHARSRRGVVYEIRQIRRVKSHPRFALQHWLQLAVYRTAGKRGAFVQHLHQRRTLRLPALTLAMTIIEQLLLQLPEVVIRLLQRGELVVKLHAVTLRASGNQRRGRIFTRRRREFLPHRLSGRNG